MQKFQLELFYHIIGIGSASGLLLNGTSLFLISDNSHVLYEYDMGERRLDKISLMQDDYTGPLENVPKKDKADYEAITSIGDELYLFGSGSTANRNTILHVDSQTKKIHPPIDAESLYLMLQDFAQIDADNFNIEAAVNDGGTWYLFNRGNGPKGQNVVFTVQGELGSDMYQIIYNEIDLPKIDGASTGFTDAVLADAKLYFIAAAEKSGSTYLDGEVGGTLIGRMDPESMEIEFSEIISRKNKFEGITLYKKTETALEFLLCEDTDSETEGADIYKLVIEK